MSIFRPILHPHSQGIVGGQPGLNPSGPPGGIHETDGLPGFPALDFLGPAGAPVVAPESGTIDRFSGHDPRLGPAAGIHGPFGWSIYLLGQSGTTYYITHLGSRTVELGRHVAAGAQIATVGDYAKWGGVDHVHAGAHGGPITIRLLGNAGLCL